jgi:PAS domain S-box-containing protein
MIPPLEHLETLYEFSMAIGTDLNLNKMLRRSISAIMKKINSPVGGVLFLREVHGRHRFEQVFSIPRDAQKIEDYRGALKAVPEELNNLQLAEFMESLPLSESTGQDRYYYIFRLSEMGIVILMKNGKELDSLFIKSLAPLFTKLATACQACIQNDEILRHRKNLEDLVEEKTRELVTRNRQLVEKINERREVEQELRDNEERYRSLFTNEIDAICIFDPYSGKVVDINNAFLKLYGYSREESDTLTLNMICSEPEKSREGIIKSLKTGTLFIQGRRHKKKDGRDIFVDISSGPFTVKGRTLMYGIIRNVSKRIRAEKERERLIIELQKALDEIKTLQGFLPICSSCKKIRDDHGYWHQIEAYISENSEAEFTHSICNTCAAKLYSKLDDEDNDKQDE